MNCCFHALATLRLKTRINCKCNLKKQNKVILKKSYRLKATGWKSETLSKMDPVTDVPEWSNEYLVNANCSFQKYMNESMPELHK